MQGVRSIDKREIFFSDFFTPETLGVLEFKYPEMIEFYGKAISKSDWKEHYLFNSPP